MEKTRLAEDKNTTKNCFSILYAKEGDSLQIERSGDTEESKKRLLELGLAPGNKISVLQEKSRYGVIVDHDNNRLAIDSTLAHSLIVSPFASKK